MSDPRLVHTLIRARAMSSARTEEMRRALAHRICFDLLQVLRPEVPRRTPSCLAPERAEEDFKVWIQSTVVNAGKGLSTICKSYFVGPTTPG